MNVFTAPVPKVIKLPGYSPGVWIVPTRRIQIWGRPDGKFAIHYPNLRTGVAKTLPAAVRRALKSK